MDNSKKTQLEPAEEPKEKVAVRFDTFWVLTDEPDEFIDKLEQLCQEYCDDEYIFYFRYDGY